MLTLPIKKKWFDMILSGEKKEEYREISDYYRGRFFNIWGRKAYWPEPHKVKFRNGYSSTSPYFIAECALSVGTGNPEWGAEPGKRYYILHILRVEDGAS